MDARHALSPRYVAILALVACVVLAGGWLARPRDVPQSPPPVPSETELRELERRAQRRSLESMTTYFSNVASNFQASLAYIGPAGASGVSWDGGRVLTGPLPANLRDRSLAVRTSSGESSATVAAWSPRLPLSVLELNRDVSKPPTARRAASMPQVGDWIVAVWRSDQAPAFAAANFRQSTTGHCGIASVQEVVSSLQMTLEMVGGGLFDMDGGLLGVILQCGDHIAAIEPAGVAAMLERVTSVQERVLARYGILFSGMSDGERGYFKEIGGLLAREVWIDTIGDAAGLQPGDVVQALNGQPVATMDDLRTLATPGDSPFELQARRGTRTETITLHSASTESVPEVPAANLGLILDSPAASYRIDSVLPGSRAARAGVRPGDRLLRIDRTAPRTRAQADRAVGATNPAPTLLEVERDTRRIALVIP